MGTRRRPAMPLVWSELRKRIGPMVRLESYHWRGGSGLESYPLRRNSILPVTEALYLTC